MVFKIEKYFYLIILLISIFSIFSALYIEHVLNISPCKLCLYQRIPYLLSSVICFFGFFLKNKIWTYLLITVFIGGILLSGYHVGIENNIFNEFPGCTNENLHIIDKSEILQSLNTHLPNCKDISFKIFNLSLATINFIISIALASFVIKYLFDEKNR